MAILRIMTKPPITRLPGAPQAKQRRRDGSDRRLQIRKTAWNVYRPTSAWSGGGRAGRRTGAASFWTGSAGLSGESCAQIGAGAGVGVAVAGAVAWIRPQQSPVGATSLPPQQGGWISGALFPWQPGMRVAGAVVLDGQQPAQVGPASRASTATMMAATAMRFRPVRLMVLTLANACPDVTIPGGGFPARRARLEG